VRGGGDVLRPGRWSRVFERLVANFYAEVEKSDLLRRCTRGFDRFEAAFRDVPGAVLGDLSATSKNAAPSPSDAPRPFRINRAARDAWLDAMATLSSANTVA